MSSYKRSLWGHVVLRRLTLVAPLALVILGWPKSNAQGTFRFSTRGPGVDAPVTFAGDNTLADCRFVAQLYGAPVGLRPLPLGSPVPFPCDGNRGYILDGGVLEVPGVAPGMSATIVVFAWSLQSGPTFWDAIEKCGATGASRPIEVVAGGGGLPASPLIGLQGFEMYVPIGECPEPNVIELFLIGATLLALHSNDHLKRCLG